MIIKNHKINFSAPRDIPNNVLIPIKVKKGKFTNVHLVDSSAMKQGFSNLALFDQKQLNITGFFPGSDNLILAVYLFILVCVFYYRYGMLICLSLHFWQCTVCLIETQTSTLNRTSTLSGHDNWSILKLLLLIEN